MCIVGMRRHWPRTQYNRRQSLETNILHQAIFFLENCNYDTRTRQRCPFGKPPTILAWWKWKNEKFVLHFSQPPYWRLQILMKIAIIIWYTCCYKNNIISLIYKIKKKHSKFCWKNCSLLKQNRPRTWFGEEMFWNMLCNHLWRLLESHIFVIIMHMIKKYRDFY